MEGRGAIVMAVYRPDTALITAQIRSIQAQTLTDWTCLVGVDGPDPAAVELVRELTVGDARFRVQSFDENVGVYRHFERLLALAPECEWVALSDQDDYWYPNKLEQLTEALNADDVTAALGQARLVSHEGIDLGVTKRLRGNLADNLLRNQVTGGFAVFRRDVISAALPFPAETQIAVHDHWLGVCASALGTVVVLDEPVQDYVQHGANVLGEASATTLTRELGSVREHGGLVAYLDYTARERWGWRVLMARELLDRGLSRNCTPFVHSVGTGRAGLPVVRDVVAAVRRKRVRARGAIGTLISAWWYTLGQRRANRVDE